MLRPGSAWPLLGVSAAVVAFLLGDSVLRGGVAETVLLAPWPLLALWGVYVSAFASAMTIDDDGVTVQNLLRVVRLPWARVDEVQWRWQVEFTTDADTRVRAVGGPVQGRGGRRPGRVDQTPTGTIAQYDAIVQAWERARERSAGAGEQIVRGWDVPALAVVAMLVAWAVIALLVTGGPA